MSRKSIGSHRRRRSERREEARVVSGRKSSNLEGGEEAVGEGEEAGEEGCQLTYQSESGPAKIWFCSGSYSLPPLLMPVSAENSPKQSARATKKYPAFVQIFNQAA